MDCWFVEPSLSPQMAAYTFMVYIPWCCPSRPLHEWSNLDKTSIFVGIYNQQFQGTIFNSGNSSHKAEIKEKIKKQKKQIKKTNQK